MLHAQRDAIHEDGMGKAEYMMSPAAGGCVCCTGWRRGGGEGRLGDSPERENA